MSYDLTIFRKGCESLGVTLSEAQEKQFTDF